MTPSKQEALLQQLQHQYRFKQPLQYYQMGVSGKPEAREQKAFIQFAMAEFPMELGFNEETGLYHRLIVATADFYDAQKKGVSSLKMQHMKKMGYQPGTPDITILYRSPFFSGFVVEAKSLTGHPTPDQQKTLVDLHTQGFYTAVCQGYAKMVEAWMHFLKGSYETSA